MLQVENIQVKYLSGDKEFLAVDKFSLSMRRGERVALLGPSGCGKTTIIKVLAGLIEASNGTLSLEGSSNMRSASIQGRIGFVPQTKPLIPWLTAIENVALPLKFKGVSRSIAYEHAASLLETLNLSEFVDYYPDQLSGGMQSRVAVARALITNPDLLLLDESLGALDELSRERIAIRLSEDWVKLDTSVVFVTHSVHEAVLLADTVLVLSQNPGTCTGKVELHEPHPRQSSYSHSIEYSNAVVELRSLLGFQ